jgi:thiol-disulfide isomerase/thioredoxin
MQRIATLKRKMKKTILFIFAISLFMNCKTEIKVDEKYVITKFQESSDKINALEYSIQRIDSFAKGGIVWNNSGNAIIEKNKKDKVFGFSFYGKRDDNPNEFIYDAGNAFEISKNDRTYKIKQGNSSFTGSPGGQMILKNIFKLDSVYKKVSLSETEKSYLLTYEFENDTIYGVTDEKKIIELQKTTFFPIKIKKSYYQFGNKSAFQATLSAVAINENVSKSIKELKGEFKDFTIIQTPKRQASQVLSKKLPDLKLPNLFDENEIVTVNTNKLTLIDFWEVWCGICIASFPEVENLKKTYAKKLNVIGIVSEDLETAIRLIKMKGTTFQNLVGNDELKKTFSISSFPRYFLVDTDGIVQKEYIGFSEQIEKDIKKSIAE